MLDALEIFSDHILIGTGPGTYGGWVSINYSLSPIYKEYGIILLGLSSIDMFWPHFLVEVGLLGLCIWIVFIFTVVRTVSRRPDLNIDMRGLITSILFGVFLIGFFN